MPLDEKNQKEMNEAFQKQVDAWLDKKFAQFGKFSLVALAAALFWALIHFIDWANGVHK